MNINEELELEIQAEEQVLPVDTLVTDELPTEDNSELVALESEFREVSYLLASIKQSGGMNRRYAEEALAIKPDFIHQNKPLGLFTQEITATEYRNSLEEISSHKKNIFMRIIQAIRDTFKRIFAWIRKQWNKLFKKNIAEKHKESVEQLKKLEQGLKEIHHYPKFDFDGFIKARLKEQDPKFNNTVYGKLKKIECDILDGDDKMIEEVKHFINDNGGIKRIDSFFKASLEVVQALYGNFALSFKSSTEANFKGEAYLNQLSKEEFLKKHEVLLNMKLHGKITSINEIGKYFTNNLHEVMEGEESTLVPFKEMILNVKHLCSEENLHIVSQLSDIMEEHLDEYEHAVNAMYDVLSSNTIHILVDEEGSTESITNEPINQKYMENTLNFLKLLTSSVNGVVAISKYIRELLITIPNHLSDLIYRSIMRTVNYLMEKAVELKRSENKLDQAYAEDIKEFVEFLNENHVLD